MICRGEFFGLEYFLEKYFGCGFLLWDSIMNEWKVDLYKVSIVYKEFLKESEIGSDKWWKIIVFNYSLSEFKF